MATRYWMVSLPVQTSAATLWNQVQETISKQSFDTPIYRFNTPNLRVGTLDSLLSLADDLLKSNAFVEGVTHKIRRQIDELERASGVDAGALTVDGVPIDSYLTRFVWDEAKYPTMSPLREIIDNIQTFVAKVEDDLKVRVAEYNNVRSQLSAINRKQSGRVRICAEMSCEGESLSSFEALNLKEIGGEFQKEPRISYGRDFLLSLAELDVCKELPIGFDQSILRSEMGDAYNSTCEHQKLCSVESLPSGRMSSDSTEVSSERWDSCKLNSKDINSTGINEITLS